jgi:hypothetical protein
LERFSRDGWVKLIIHTNLTVGLEALAPWKMLLWPSYT